MYLSGIHDTLHNDIKYNNIQHKRLICDRQHKRLNTQHNSALHLQGECHYAECHILFIVMLNIVMLSVIILSVVMLSVVAPLSQFVDFYKYKN